MTGREGSSRPPNEFARLVLFADLVDEYDDLTRGLASLPGSVFIDPTAKNSVVPAASHRLALLRKFCLAPGDEVHAERVLDAMAACCASPDALGTVDALRRDFCELAQLFTLDEGGPSAASMQHVVRDWLYGGVLHADYSKHANTVMRSNLTLDLALWHYVLEAENYVRRLRRAVRLGIAERVLRDR